MKRRFDYISRVIFFLVGFCSLAGERALCQDASSETEDVAIEPSGIGIAVDYGKLLTLPSDFERKAEVAVSFNLRKRLMVLAEVGYARLMPGTAVVNGDYASEGLYLRFGTGYGGQILPKSFLYSAVFFGTSQYDETGKIEIEGQGWPDLNEPINRKALTSSWFELALITEQEIKENLLLGAKLRYRFNLTFDETFQPSVYSIPGYGRTIDNSVPAVNLFIKYRLSF